MSPITLQVGLVDLEINRLTKILFVATVMLSLLLLIVKVEEGDDGATGSVLPHWFLSFLQGFSGPWFVYLIRYIILFSYIIPIRWVAHTYPSHILTPSHPHTLTQPSCEPGHGEGSVLMDDPEG